MKKVLIIDDSETARMFTRRCLQMAGIEAESIQEFASATDAVFCMTDPDVELMVIDLVMPGLSGKQFLQMRKNAGVLAPAMVVSSAVNATEEAELKALGAALVIKKPITPASASAALLQLGLLRNV
jgi:two-component system, chemotaxis family, chemotaxis protein CheY